LIFNALTATAAGFGGGGLPQAHPDVAEAAVIGVTSEMG
jgi:hypothetical protein